MIDLNTEVQLMTLEEARSHRLLLKQGGKKRSFNSLLRWTRDGYRGITLESVILPSGVHTSEAAIIRFIERLSEPGATQNSRTSTTATKAHKHAMAALKAAGI